MTLQQIQSFIAVTDSGSFTKAEGTTFLTKQALRKQIDALESELEFELFSRDTKGIRLTEAGKVFYSAMKEQLQNLNQLIENCRAISMEKNHLRIGNPPHPRLLLEDTYSEFSRRYPDIQIDIVVSRHQLAQKILNKELDIAEFVYRPNLLIPGVSYQRVCIMHYSCVVAATHPLASKESIEPGDLVPYPIGLAVKYNLELYNYLHENFPEISFQDMPESVMNNIMNICYNQGIYISKAYFTRLLAPLVSIPLHSPIEFECGVIYRSDSVNPNVDSPIANFLTLLKEMYPEYNSKNQRENSGPL